MDESYIAVNQVSFAYPTADTTSEPIRLALNHVNLAVRPGEFVAVLGMNGSGKSTLARHLNALLLPRDGTVLVDGMDTREEKHLWAIRDRVGMVFQNPDNQIVAAVVEEDVAFGPENQGRPPEEIRQRVAEALAAVGMSHMRERAPHLLSGGQKQRVAIAGALALRPACLVLDEPTAMLDPSGRAEVADVVHRLNRELGMAVVWITHFMEEAALADRVIVMADGQVQLEGPPRTVFNQADQLRAFRLDVPPAVSAAERLRAEGVPMPEGILTLQELVEALCQLRSAT
jgi:energy-coupling factor transport system ATP-binding protein